MLCKLYESWKKYENVWGYFQINAIKKKSKSKKNLAHIHLSTDIHTFQIKKKNIQEFSINVKIFLFSGENRIHVRIWID